MKVERIRKALCVGVLAAGLLGGLALNSSAAATLGNECDYNEVKDSCTDLACSKPNPGYSCRKTPPPDVSCQCTQDIED